MQTPPINELVFPFGPVSLEGFAADNAKTSLYTPWQLEPVELVFGVLIHASRIAVLQNRELEITEDELVQSQLDSDVPRELRLRAELRSIRAELGGVL
jgi:hypothetical protein